MDPNWLGGVSLGPVLGVTSRSYKSANHEWPELVAEHYASIFGYLKSKGTSKYHQLASKC